MFGNTPTGIIILDIVLVLMGMILSPLLWGIFTRLGTISTALVSCITSLAETQKSLARVIDELNEARVRDTALEGSIKGINEKLDNKIR